ncbi:hypothetical protein EON82_12250 [bacterium]|nr:MAG: hypothetical protein EON82_12250 [bacterium]
MVAILPAAGKGTRMAAVTGGRSKELLPLGGAPTIARVIGEVRQAGIERIVIVGSPDKPDLDEFAALYRVEMVHQPTMRGLADAIASADIDDDAVVLLGDGAYFGGSPVARMAELLEKGIDGAVAVEQTDDAGTLRYGIVDIDEWRGGIKQIVEKPGPDATTSRWAVAGRYALSRRLMAFLSEQVQAHTGPGELGMTAVINAALAEGFDLKAVALQEGMRRVDVGTPEEYEEALRLRW